MCRARRPARELVNCSCLERLFLLLWNLTGGRGHVPTRQCCAAQRLRGEPCAHGHSGEVIELLRLFGVRRAFCAEVRSSAKFTAETNLFLAARFRLRRGIRRDSVQAALCRIRTLAPRRAW